MTTSVNRPLTEAEQVFKQLIWLPMLRAGETYIEGVAPVLAIPGVKQLEEGAIDAIAEWTFRQILLFIDVTAIRLINSAHQTAFDHACLQLKIVAIESGVDSDAYKNARTAAAVALSQFTRFNA